MKRLLFAVLAVSFMAAPMANAQKVNKEAIVAKLAKADADANDAKKGSKAATWVARGKAYYEAAVAPSKDIFAGMDYQMAAISIGKANSSNQNVELNGAVYTEHVYPMLKVYVAADNQIKTWIVTQPVKEGDLLGEAVKSYAKAIEMDPKQAAAVDKGLKEVENHHSAMGNVCLEAGLFADAAEHFFAAYNAQSVNGYVGEKNNQYLYYAGYLYVVDGATNPASYAKGVDHLRNALAAGYADEEGMIYYYLFHAYFGQKDSSVRVANMQEAKKVLMEGLAKFPANTRIIEGLIALYTDPQNAVGDPQELVEMVDGALQRDPQNKDLWNSRALMFNSMKNYEESIKSFEKVVELDPQNVQAAFNLGLMYIFQADDMNEAMNSRDYKSNAEFQADQKKVIESYMLAVPVLEKAYELAPNNVQLVETLKSLTFRLRDEEGMMAKYEKYNTALSALK